MRHGMWMGTRGFEMWVPVPSVGPAYGLVGYSSSTQLLNGGLTQRGSKSGHGSWALTWPNGTSWDDIAPIRDMANGVYDTAIGINPVYWLDPTAMGRNVMPPHWATPHLAAEDAMPLLQGVVPGLRVESAGSYRLPARSALYPASSAARAKLYIPIPPGHIFRFGWVGDESSAGQVQVADVDPDGATSSNIATPDPNPFGATGLWTNLDLPANGERSGVEISVAGTAALGIRAMLATVTPASQVPRKGLPWRGGAGNSGCQFVDKVGLSPQSVPLDQTGASTTLVETGAWL